MKLLIGAACIAIIALAVYLIGGDMLKSRAQNRQEFAASCDLLLLDGQTLDPANMSESEKSRRVRKISQCLDFLKTGKLP